MMMLYFYSEANDLMMKFNTPKVEKRLILVWVQLRPSQGNLQLASSEQLYDPLPDEDKWIYMRIKAQRLAKLY